MDEPLLHRKNIPFFYHKSEAEFKEDHYEKYDPSVLRQSMLHLSDQLWGAYPLQSVFDYVKLQVEQVDCKDILEIGCGVGRLIAELATSYPKANCWGMDYSYQLLKKAREIWMDGEDSEMNFSRYGFDSMHKIVGRALTNVQFGLCKAEQLPFSDNSQDVIVSSFLFDRLLDPIQGVREMKRVLRKNGRIIIVTPLNFIKATHWEKFYPPIKLYSQLQTMGFSIVDWREDLLIEEPLDLRGNRVQWQCVAIVLM